MAKQIIPAKLTFFSEGDLVSTLTSVYKSELGIAPDSDTLAILCAQVALETADGKKCMCFNLGNFKAPNQDQGSVDWCYFATTEYSSQGKPIVIRPPDRGCSFAAFATLTDGATYYLRRMYDHWTLAWQAALKGDVEGYAKGLKAQGYYTAPVDSYVKGVKAWFDHYTQVISLSVGETHPVPPDPSSFADLALGWYIDTPSVVGS